MSPPTLIRKPTHCKYKAPKTFQTNYGYYAVHLSNLPKAPLTH